MANPRQSEHCILKPPLAWSLSWLGPSLGKAYPKAGVVYTRDWLINLSMALENYKACQCYVVLPFSLFFFSWALGLSPSLFISPVATAIPFLLLLNFGLDLSFICLLKRIFRPLLFVLGL
jgi:hypothetical protein